VVKNGKATALTGKFQDAYTGKECPTPA
jgi:hypothetical protein